MVWLVWSYQTFPAPSEAKLIGVWPSEDEAKKHAVEKAAELSGGSGLVTESMMGDAWEAVNRALGRFAVHVESAKYGKQS